MKLYHHIQSLVQIRENLHVPLRGQAMKELPSIENAWLAERNGLIEDYGPMSTIEDGRFDGYQRIACDGKFVLPAWVDSHTHIVFAAWREKEFVDRIHGLSYEEIAGRGGGILNSVERLRKMTEDQLFENAMQRLDGLVAMGTGAIEIKSGYGLNLESELKMLRVIRRIKAEAEIPVRATFLGAHAIPLEFKGNADAYVQTIIDSMLPPVASEGLADFVDVFCEKGYFNVDQTVRIISAAKAFGLRSKIHVNQFNAIGGVEACVSAGVLSLDHLEVMTEQDFTSLEQGNTIAVALPQCSFFLGIPYTPVREMIQRGIPLALASDFNPGSSPSGNMNFVVSLACIHMKMTPEEAINAATINAAFAMGVEREVGSITRGKKANLIITQPMNSLHELPYRFGENPIERVIVNGK